MLYLGIEALTNTVFINISGSTQQWFAIGFGYGTSMKNKYAIIIDWTTGSTQEQQYIGQDNILEYFLGNHAIGQKLDPLLERKTQFQTTHFRRNVLMERPTFKMDDDDGNYFNFSICNEKYDIIWARGTYSGSRKNPQNFELGSGHAGYDRGSTTIHVVQVDDGKFTNCSWTISISQTINWKLIISLMFSIILSL